MTGVPAVELMGVRVDNVDEAGVVERIRSSLEDGRGGWVATPNVDILRQLVADRDLAVLVEQADLVIPDGMPLVWASRLQGTPLQARVPGSELIYPLAFAAAAHGFRMYLLGGDRDVAERAADVLLARAPGLQIAGTYSPPQGFESDAREVADITRLLTTAAPDIVICAFGFPKQERLMTVLRDQLPATWFVGAGGTLTITSGRTPAAPTWMRRHGLEWLHRLRLEPRRLFRRYVIDDVPFAIRLLAVSARSTSWRGDLGHPMSPLPSPWPGGGGVRAGQGGR